MNVRFSLRRSPVWQLGHSGGLWLYAVLQDNWEHFINTSITICPERRGKDTWLVLSAVLGVCWGGLQTPASITDFERASQCYSRIAWESLCHPVSHQISDVLGQTIVCPMTSFFDYTGSVIKEIPLDLHVWFALPLKVSELDLVTWKGLSCPVLLSHCRDMPSAKVFFFFYIQYVVYMITGYTVTATVFKSKTLNKSERI